MSSSDIVAVWRVADPQLDLGELLQRFPQFAPDASWRRGDTRAGREAHSNSGFNLTLAEADSGEVMSRRLHDALDRWRGLFDSLKDATTPSELDVGLFIDVDVALMKSVVLDAALLRRLGDLNVSVRLSAYLSEG